MGSQIEQIHAEALADILGEQGIKLPVDKIATVAKEFYWHLENFRSMHNDASYSLKKECDTCKSLKKEIKEMEKEISVYQNSVKQRRHASRVWIEGDSVMFEK